MPRTKRHLHLKRGSPLRLGKVYLFVSPKYRPGQFKIGAAGDELQRLKNGKTWLSDVAVAYEKSFLHDYNTEQALHAEFEKWRDGDSEWFTGDIEVAKKAVDRKFAEEAADRAALNDVVRQALEIGLVEPGLTKTTNTALEALWAWHPCKGAPAVGELIPLSLSGQPRAVEAGATLRKAGVIPSNIDGLCLLELSETSRLTRFLNRAIGKGRWEHQVKEVAGFTAEGLPVTIEAWHKKTRLDAASISLILGRGNNPQLLAA